MSGPRTIALALASLLDVVPEWLPPVNHWEIAEDTNTWILSGQLAGDLPEAPAFRLLAPMIEVAETPHSDDGRLVRVPFTWEGVVGQVWYLRPIDRWVVPERCATCPTLLADVGYSFVRLGNSGAPVICLPCRDRMYASWVATAAKPIVDLAEAVRELGALPMPVGTAEAAPDGITRLIAPTQTNCTLLLTRHLACGHCPHEVCQDCDRCPCSCRCASGGA